jgi:hypothetical protein
MMTEKDSNEVRNPANVDWIVINFEIVASIVRIPGN